MNDRIKEMITEAGMYHDSELYEISEKVIKECIILAQREIIRNGTETPHNQAIYKVIDSIKQHFGVEYYER